MKLINFVHGLLQHLEVVIINHVVKLSHNIFAVLIQDVHGQRLMDFANHLVVVLNSQVLINMNVQVIQSIVLVHHFRVIQ